jgi:hypothetical protein
MEQRFAFRPFLDERTCPMPRTKDLWYVRFPDGRVRRAADPTVIREQLAAGRLPPGTHVRRSLDQEWRSIERLPEFANVKPTLATNGPAPATIASRLDGTRLPLAGVRDLVEDLQAALDSTFSWRKLTVAALAGLMLGGLAALARLDQFAFTLTPPGLGWLLPLAALLVWSWLAVVLSKMTYTEVSLLRPARWKDGLSGSIGASIQLALVQAVVLAVLGGAIVAVRWVPGWLATAGSEENANVFLVAAQAATAAGVVLELLLWPLFLLVLPLATVFVVEQGRAGSGLGQWLRLAWRPGRLLLAEGLALGVGLLLAAPLALLVAALASRSDPPELALASAMSQGVLYGLIGAVFLAYLVVANVFIYLHLRYDHD